MIQNHGTPPTHQPPTLLAQVRGGMRARHSSLRTEEASVRWMRRFILFHGTRPPREMGGREVQPCLTHPAVEGRVAASTQRQALSALVLLYHAVLKQDMGWLNEVVRALGLKALLEQVRGAVVHRVQGERTPGPLCPDTLANNLMPCHVPDLEALCKGALRTLATAGVVGKRVTGIADGADLEITARARAGMGQAATSPPCREIPVRTSTWGPPSMTTPSTTSTRSSSASRAAPAGRCQPSGGGRRRGCLRASSTPRRATMRPSVRTEGRAVCPCTRHAWWIATAPHAPRSLGSCNA